MCTPSYDSGNGEDRGIQFQRNLQHAVYETAVEINVGADTLVDPGFLGNDLRCDPLATASFSTKLLNTWALGSDRE